MITALISSYDTISIVVHWFSGKILKWHFSMNFYDHFLPVVLPVSFCNSTSLAESCRFFSTKVEWSLLVHMFAIIVQPPVLDYHLLSCKTVTATLETTLYEVFRMPKGSNSCTHSKIPSESATLVGLSRTWIRRRYPPLSWNTIKEVFLLFGNFRNILQELLSVATKEGLGRGTRCLYNKMFVEPRCRLRRAFRHWKSLEHGLLIGLIAWYLEGELITKTSSSFIWVESCGTSATSLIIGQGGCLTGMSTGSSPSLFSSRANLEPQLVRLFHLILT